MSSYDPTDSGASTAPSPDRSAERCGEDKNGPCESKRAWHELSFARENFVAWPSIGKYRDFKKHFDARAKNPHGEDLAHLTDIVFTVKLHGTNGAVGFTADGAAWCQSRNHILSPESTNGGFYTFAEAAVRTGAFARALAGLRLGEPGGPRRVVFFGEWCGGNVQPRVALERCPKHFAVFCVLVDDERRAPDFEDAPGAGLFNLHAAPLRRAAWGWTAEHLAEAEAASRELAAACDAQCPWALRFGADGPGEGAVAQLVSRDGVLAHPKFWFKAKGEAHLNHGKRGKKGAVEAQYAIPEDAGRSLDEAAGLVLTEERLDQACAEASRGGTLDAGAALRWLLADVEREEADVLRALEEQLELDRRQILKRLQKNAVSAIMGRKKAAEAMNEQPSAVTRKD